MRENERQDPLHVFYLTISRTLVQGLEEKSLKSARGPFTALIFLVTFLRGTPLLIPFLGHLFRGGDVVDDEAEMTEESTSS